MNEPSLPSHPGPETAGPASGTLGSVRAHWTELLGVGAEVVAVSAGPVDVAAAVLVPGEHRVEVGLVADLEGVDVPAPDPLHEGPALGGGDRRAPGGEVDAEDQLGVQIGGERLGRAQPALGQRIVDAALGDLAADRPPRPVGAVAPDPDDRRLARGQAAEQPEQRRVDGTGVTAGVLMQRPVLEGGPQEAGRHLLTGGRRRDAGAEDVGARGDRPGQDESERRHDGDADAAAKHSGPYCHTSYTYTSPRVRLTRQALGR